jgi:hypothetical protein
MERDGKGREGKEGEREGMGKELYIVGEYVDLLWSWK